MRNEQLVPQYSAYAMVAFSLGMLFVSKGLDAIGIHTGTNTSMASMNFATDFAAILVFSSYGIIILSGLINRYTNKVQTDRS